MSASVRACALAVLLSSVAAAAPAEPPAKLEQRPAHREPPWVALNRPISTEGVEKAPLKDVLEHLSEKTGVDIRCDARAFGEESVAAVEDTPITLRRTRDVPLRVVLRHVCRELMADEAVLMTREDGLEITTRRKAAVEVGRNPELLLPPLVSVVVTEKPAADALREVATQSGVSVVIDPRVAATAEKLNVTAKLLNVPAETAVRLLAGFADLGVASTDNVLLVTTPERAKALQGEHRKELKRLDAEGRAARTPPPA